MTVLLDYFANASRAKADQSFNLHVEIRDVQVEVHPGPAGNTWAAAGAWTRSGPSAL